MDLLSMVYYISSGISIIGIAIILWGVLLTFVGFLRIEFTSLSKKKICTGREVIRHRFGSYLLLGLEFLIAADIVTTVLHPTLDEIFLLGGLVIIRTLIGHFLDTELADTHIHGESRA